MDDTRVEEEQVRALEAMALKGSQMRFDDPEPLHSKLMFNAEFMQRGNRTLD